MSQAAILGRVKAHDVLSPRKRQRVVPECRSSGKQQHCWSSIHRDVFENILKHLSLVDILRCRAVCSAWRSITRSYITSSLDSCASLQQHQPPLLLWYRPLSNGRGCDNWFLDVARPGKNMYHTNSKSKQVLWRKTGSCVGFSQHGGWFLFLGKEGSRNSSRLYLFHPLLFSTSVARFPRIETPNKVDSCKDIERVVLLSDPVSTSGGGYGIIAIHASYKNLLFAKCGDSRFSELECQDGNGGWYDIVLVGSCLYGIAFADDDDDEGCCMVAWDCSDSTNPRHIVDFRVDFKHPGSGSSTGSILRLLESQGELLLVCVHRPDSRYIHRIMKKENVGTREVYPFVLRADMCEVYKMDFKEKEWVPMESLGDRALFIMQFQAVSVSTREFPQYKRNAVYFKHKIDYPGCFPVVGVYNLEDGSMDEIIPRS